MQAMRIKSSRTIERGEADYQDEFETVDAQFAKTSPTG
jgi:hypothetical protein